MAKSHGVKIKAYHTDNLRFNDINYKGSCIKVGQKLTFCEVGAHHQNTIAESKIKSVLWGRTSLLHAKGKLPKIIHTILWPCAIQAVVERHTILSLDKHGDSHEIVPTDFHTWRCLVYIPEESKQ